jgi:glyoxylase-like metal-dependent hydrolase (beta-lactamase superfamily II)
MSSPSGRPPLSLDVYISGYKPIPSLVPDWPESWQATWPATTATLISGDEGGVLVDSLLTMKESHELAGWLRGRGTNVSEVYITHGHADHFFGLNSVLEAYPQARAVALPRVVPFLQEQTTPEWMKVWEGFFPGQLTDQPVVPGPLAKNELSVEGHVIEVVPLGQSDVTDSSALHIPELDVVIAGDVVYNGIHPWMYQSDHAQRMSWIDTLNQVEELAPTTIIAGHKEPHAPDDDAARTLEATRQYIRDFDAQVAASASGAQLVEAMTEKYPDLGNPYTLWLAAYAQPHNE